jgi:hypothetical protein
MKASCVELRGVYRQRMRDLVSFGWQPSLGLVEHEVQTLNSCSPDIPPSAQPGSPLRHCNNAKEQLSIDRGRGIEHFNFGTLVVWLITSWSPQ